MYFWSVSLVYQLSGQFLIFLVDHKNNLVDQKIFGITKKKICSTKKWEIDRTIGIPKETDQKYMDAAYMIVPKIVPEIVHEFVH